MIDLPARQHLMQWYMPWLKEHEGSDLIYKDAASRQIHFVRDDISGLVRPRVPYHDRPDVNVPLPDGRPNTVKETALVVGEHTSKSVRLPVYGFERPDLGLRMMLRCNFYNWKLSVQSERAIVNDAFPMLFKVEGPPEPEYTGDDLHPVYFEGFPREWCFRYYGESQSRWSAEVGSDQQIWTVMFLIMKELGNLQPFRYHTRESHRAELDAESAAQKRNTLDAPAAP